MKIKCKCPCHENSNLKHIVACCDNGWIDIGDEPYIKQIGFGRWEIFDGEEIITTGYEGVKDYQEKVFKAVQQEIKKIKNDIRSNNKG